MTPEKARAMRILSVYDRAVARFDLALRMYNDAADSGNSFALVVLAPLVRRRAAAIIATIGEATPEASV